MLFLLNREKEAVSAIVPKSPADIEGGNSYLLCSSLLGAPLAAVSGSLSWWKMQSVLPGRQQGWNWKLELVPWGVLRFTLLLPRLWVHRVMGEFGLWVFSLLDGESPVLWLYLFLIRPQQLCLGSSLKIGFQGLVSSGSVVEGQPINLNPGCRLDTQ